MSSLIKRSSSYNRNWHRTEIWFFTRHLERTFLCIRLVYHKRIIMWFSVPFLYAGRCVPSFMYEILFLHTMAMRLCYVLFQCWHLREWVFHPAAYCIFETLPATKVSVDWRSLCKESIWKLFCPKYDNRGIWAFLDPRLFWLRFHVHLVHTTSGLWCQWLKMRKFQFVVYLVWRQGIAHSRWGRPLNSTTLALTRVKSHRKVYPSVNSMSHRDISSSKGNPREYSSGTEGT